MFAAIKEAVMVLADNTVWREGGMPMYLSEGGRVPFTINANETHQASGTQVSHST